MARFTVAVSRDGGSFPVRMGKVARGANVVGMSDDGIDGFAWSGDNPAAIIREACQFAQAWDDVNAEVLTMSLLVRVDGPYDAHLSGGGELAHVGTIDLNLNVDVNVTDQRVWESLNGGRVRFVS